MPVPTLPAADDVTIGGLTDDDTLRVKGNFPFLLIHRPFVLDAYSVETDGMPDGQAYWVPNLTPWVLREGTNGVTTLTNGQPEQAKFSKAFEILRNQQATVLPLSGTQAVKVTDPAHLPPNVAPGGYLRARKCLGGRQFYHTCWEIPRQPVGTNDIGPKVYNAPKNAFALALITEYGLLAPPTEEWLSVRIADFQRRVTRMESETETATAEIRERRVGAARAALEAAKTAIVPTLGMFDEAKPKRRRKGAA